VRAMCDRLAIRIHNGILSVYGGDERHVAIAVYGRLSEDENHMLASVRLANRDPRAQRPFKRIHAWVRPLSGPVQSSTATHDNSRMWVTVGRIAFETASSRR